MKEYKARERTVKAVRANGENLEDFVEMIGPASQFLSMTYGTVGGPGRGAQKALIIKSAFKEWCVRDGEWLVMFPDGGLRTFDDIEFYTFFEEAE